MIPNATTSLKERRDFSVHHLAYTITSKQPLNVPKNVINCLVVHTSGSQELSNVNLIKNVTLMGRSKNCMTSSFAKGSLQVSETNPYMAGWLQLQAFMYHHVCWFQLDHIIDRSYDTMTRGFRSFSPESTNIDNISQGDGSWVSKNLSCIFQLVISNVFVNVWKIYEIYLAWPKDDDI